MSFEDKEWVHFCGAVSYLSWNNWKTEWDPIQATKLNRPETFALQFKLQLHDVSKPSELLKDVAALVNTCIDNFDSHPVGYIVYGVPDEKEGIQWGIDGSIESHVEYFEPDGAFERALRTNLTHPMRYLFRTFSCQSDSMTANFAFLKVWPSLGTFSHHCFS